MKELICLSAVVLGAMILVDNKTSYTPLASAAAASAVSQDGVSVVVEGETQQSVCKGRDCKLRVKVDSVRTKLQGKIRRRTRLFRRRLFNRRG